LDYKFIIFFDICNRADVLPIAYLKAFPTILKGMALDHFYNHQLFNRPFEEVCTHLKNFFEEANFQRKYFEDWNSITLSTVIAENSNKTTAECLQILITNLKKIQQCLNPKLRNSDFYYNKLVTACQGVPACRYAISDPLADLGILVSKLQSVITAYKKKKSIDKTQTQVYFTNRRYHREDKSGRSRDRNRPWQSSQSSRPWQDRPTNRYTNRPTPRCFVCKKEGCRS